MEVQAVILAAGDSTRMKSKIPKILHKIGNLELINHVLKSILSLNVKQTILVCNQNLVFQNRFLVQFKKIIQKEKLGTAHAVSVALPFLQYKITLILYGDVPLIQSAILKKLIEQIKNGADISLLLFNVERQNAAYGRVIFDGNSVQKIVEHKDSKEVRENFVANSGVMAIRTELLHRYIPYITNKNAQNEHYLTDIVEFAVNDGKNIFYHIVEESDAAGVNDRFDLERLERHFQNSMRNLALQNGVTLLDSKSVYFSYDTIVERDAVIHQNVIFGEGVFIKSATEILAFSHIENVIIHSGAKIGPFARIRGSSEIQKDAVIGNFVEVKNSQIEQNVKIKHLSYIGDAYIGSESNIGAGTIFCNFNGKEKNKTFVGIGCFLGGNNTIVAPVKIGDYAKTGAGSTITKDIPENALAIARALQVIKEHNPKSVE